MLQCCFARALHRFLIALRSHPNQYEDDRNDDHQLDQRESRFHQHAVASPPRTLATSNLRQHPQFDPRSNYQSEYLVPSSAVLVDFEYMSNTFFPPQLVESGSSWTARSPHSARPVMGSTGIFRRKRIFRSLAVPSCTPCTRVSRSGG